MKKTLFIAAMCCLSMIAFTGCETDVTGDQMYELGVSEETSTASYMSYKASGAEDKICTALTNAGAQQQSGSTTFIINGARKQMNKKMAAAVNKAMDEFEAESNYGSLYDLSETTVVLKQVSSENSDVVVSRTFKAIK